MNTLAGSLIPKRGEAPEIHTHPNRDESGPKMNTVQWYGAKDMRVIEEYRPVVTDPADAVIKVTSAAICGSDLHLYLGAMPGMKKGDIMGHETMGIVESVGPNVTSLKPGDRVVVAFDIACNHCLYCQKGAFSGCDNTNPSKEQEMLYGHHTAGLFGYSQLTGGYPGGQAEYLRIPFADTNCLKIREDQVDLPDDKVILISDVLATAWHANELGSVQKGDNVVIWGAGPVGMLAAHCAQARGAARVVLVDQEEFRLEFARQRLPGVETIDFTKKKTLDALHEMFQDAEGRYIGPDVVIEAVGFHYTKSWTHWVEMALKLENDPSEILNELIYSVRKAGRIAVVGVYSGYCNHLNIGSFMEKGLSMAAGQTPVQKYWHHLLKLVKEGVLKPEMVITHHMPLEKAPEAYKMFNDKVDGCVKVVLKPEMSAGGQKAMNGMEEPSALANASSQSTSKLHGSHHLVVKGEGGANVVVEYKNSKNQDQVIRLRKTRSSKEKQPQNAGIDESIWPELKEQGASFLSLQSDLIYIKDILTPFLGSQYIPPQELINFDAEETKIYGASQGVLMPDVTLLPSQTPLPPPFPLPPPNEHFSTVCIEIKPKYGSITKCSTVRRDDVELKHSTSRYQLHQLLKQDRGTINTVSSYDPVDLFSNENERIENALHSLLENPQNNLGIFINGQPFNLGGGSDGNRGGGDGCGEIETETLLDRAINAAADALLPLVTGDYTSYTDETSDNDKFTIQEEEEEEEESHKDGSTSLNKNKKQYLVTLLRLIFQQEPVLENIGKAQQACHVDIEGIYLLYQKMLHLNKDKETQIETGFQNIDTQFSNILSEQLQHQLPFDDKLNSSESSTSQATAQHVSTHEEAMATLLQLPSQDAINILRSYIISATARDCSIMITMRSVGGSESISLSSEPAIEQNNGTFTKHRLQTESENGIIFTFSQDPVDSSNSHHSIGGGVSSANASMEMSIEYRISIVDLDRKSTLKIPKHYELDKEIMLAAKKQMQK